MHNNLQALNEDVKTLLKDAQALLNDASTLTGDKADEARQRGKRLLDRAVSRVHEAQDNAIAKGKKIVHSTDDYINENPWRVISVAAGAGVLLGMLLSQNKQ